MKKLNEAYLIPLILLVFGLVGVHTFTGLFTMAILGFILFIPVIALAVALPILWVVASFKKWENAILWSKVGLLSISAVTIVPLFSLVTGEIVHECQMNRLAFKLDQYKNKTGRYPAEINSAAPFFLSLGIWYYPGKDGRDCKLMYSQGLMSAQVLSNKNGEWEREVWDD